MTGKPTSTSTLLPEEKRFPLPALWRRWTARWRPLPDAILVGVQRAGTTSLFRYLAQHPCVVTPTRKEVHFFDHDVNWARGERWYRAHFPAARELARRARADGRRRVVVEGTPAYLFRPWVPERMRSIVPDARLVAVLRDPVARALSNWKLAGEWSRQQGPFEVEVEHELALEEGRPGPLGDEKPRGLLARGRYAEQLERLFAHFPRERVLVLDSAELLRDPTAACAPLFRFLDLEPIEVDARKRHNLSRDSSAVAPEVRARLEAYFAPWDARLAELLGRTPSWRA